MTTVDTNSGTRVEEIADHIFQVHVPVRGASFSFNQYVLLDDEPLLFHTGGRSIFPLVRAAIAHVVPLEKLRHVAWSHYEADECGAINELLAVAPNALPAASAIGAMIGSDAVDKPVRALADGESFSIGKMRLKWIAAPHLPHGWDCGHLFEETTRTLLCGDLFTQPGGGASTPALATQDILDTSEQFRTMMDYYAHAADSRALFEKVARTEPTTLACMHGSAWKGDGAALIRALADCVTPARA